TWDVSAAFGAAGISSLDNVKWGVLGDKNVLGLRYAWTTTDGSTPLTLPNTPVWGTLDTATRSIASQFSNLTLGQSVSPDSTFDNSWNQQTIVGPLATQYRNVYENPNVTGLTTATFYKVRADGSAPDRLGTFTLGPNGNVAFV